MCCDDIPRVRILNKNGSMNEVTTSAVSFQLVPLFSSSAHMHNSLIFKLCLIFRNCNESCVNLNFSDG